MNCQHCTKQLYSVKRCNLQGVYRQYYHTEGDHYHCLKEDIKAETPPPKCHICGVLEPPHGQICSAGGMPPYFPRPCDIDAAKMKTLLECLHFWKAKPGTTWDLNAYLRCDKCELDVNPEYLQKPERARLLLEAYAAVIKSSREIYRLIYHESPAESHQDALIELEHQESALWPLVKIITEPAYLGIMDDTVN